MRREKGKETPGFPPGPLTGVCCDGSPERLVDPCLELNLFHDSANLPRLAFRLHLRLSPPSSRSEPPRSISAASLHFFPMRSSPLPAGRHVGGARGSGSLLSPQVSLPPGRSSLLAPPLPPPGSCQSPALCYRVATRLRLRPRSAPLGWDCERQEPASFCAPNCSPPRSSSRPESHVPHLGLWMRRGVVTSSHLTPPRRSGLETNLTPPLAAGASLGHPHGVGGGSLDLEKDRKCTTLSSLLSLPLSPVSCNNCLLSVLSERRASSPCQAPS